ncbi:hypothetical protein N0O92_17640 [Alkalihalobacillus sp. MEB130]|uniref:hypothetical protein n=1 Tax=Alkalihalobacillus sp. MEB130 TaxID=2976704 RepID=UPI0028DF745A|nr:hypothetical protein [Alkalihalobacillus sp. MEB130]MDT8862036.1 hypothetical protein [Alkalihalobacillus sp. MEB130]
MIEFISDMTMLWETVLLTFLIVAAFTKANVLLIEWQLRTNWKKHSVDTVVRSEVNVYLSHPSSNQYRPKIPSLIDHKNQADEEPNLVVF